MGATEQDMGRRLYVSDDWPQVIGVTYQGLLDAMETIGSKYETKEAHMSDVERVRIEFNYHPHHYGVNHPVGRAVQDLYRAVVDDMDSFLAANWVEHKMRNRAEDA